MGYAGETRPFQHNPNFLYSIQFNLLNVYLSWKLSINGRIHAMSILPACYPTAITNLRMRALAFAAFSIVYLTSGYALLHVWWSAEYALRWLVIAAGLTVYLQVILWRNLEANHRAGESQLLTAFGIGNSLTLLRGLFIAAMAGFLLSPIPPGRLVWLPGILYTLACAADFMDGYLARLTNHSTHLGEILDLGFDGLGVLTAVLLAVQYGQVPVWYLLVALARYLFLAGQWALGRLGRPVYDLPPRPSRRVFAGLQMGFLAVALYPVFSAPALHLAAAFFGLPLLAGFLRDWLYVSGVLRADWRLSQALHHRIHHDLPLLLRGLVLAFGLSLFVKGGEPVALLGLFLAAVSLGVLLGISGRLLSILGLILLGHQQTFVSLSVPQVLLGAAFVAILYLGSGRYSLWKPEEHLFHRRAGEKRQFEAERTG